jgi:hypothetical protein
MVVGSVIVDKLMSLGMQFPDEVPDLESYRSTLEGMIVDSQA